MAAALCHYVLTMPVPRSPTQILRSLALRHTEVEEGIACKGTAVESSSFKVRKKTFLFARDVEMMVKLQESLSEAKRFASQDPSRYRVGGGWVSVKFGAGALPPRELLTRWVAESYRLMAGQSGAVTQNKGGSPAAKKKAARSRR